MTQSATEVRRGFAPTLVCYETILRNGPTRADLGRLAHELDRFADALIETGEDLPEPLVGALEQALDSVAFVSRA